MRHPVAGDDDLAAGLGERVEGVEELFLGPLLACDELDVVDQEEVDAVAVALTEAGHVARGDRRDQVIHEALGREVADAEGRVGLQRGEAGGLHEVGLPEPHAAVEEERVVELAERLGDRRHAPCANSFDLPTTKRSKREVGATPDARASA